MDLLQHPVVIGILSALGGAFIAWLFFLFDKMKLSRELKKMRGSLADQMEITAEGNKSLKERLNKLNEENQNLRVSIQSWQQKPDRKELRMLYVYDKAAAKLIEEAPGFGPLWLKAVKEAEQEISKSEKGLFAFTKNLLGLKGTQKLKAYEEIEEGEVEEEGEK
ncbi:MAG: hypothetical protein ACQESP_06630 [Candidatus Muiribacteriota bacterium]